MILYNNHYKIEFIKNDNRDIYYINIYSEDGFNLINSILVSEITFNEFIDNCINLLEFGIKYSYMNLPLYSTREYTKIEFIEEDLHKIVINTFNVINGLNNKIEFVLNCDELHELIFELFYYV